MKKTRMLVVLGLLLASCGTKPTSGPGAPDAPPVDDVLNIICQEDGATEVTSRDVAAQVDGVHFRVDNRAGEFVSLNGTGMDFSEGVTEEATRVPPGEVKVACWPGSMHEDPEPERVAITVHDQDGFWVPAELECPRDKMIGEAVLDYASDSTGAKGNPEELARQHVKGLEPDDRIFTSGYPEAAYRDVAIERQREIVALLSYIPTEDGGWLLEGHSACPSAGIDY